MKKANPLISIVMPIYNVENYLVECMNSVVSQDYSNLEIICVDDGSTDSSGQILDDFAVKDPRVRVIHNPNQGYGKTMNQGLLEAKGDWIGVVETDDYISENMFSRLLEVALENDVEVIKSDFLTFTRNDDGSENSEYTPLSTNNDLYNQVINPCDYDDVFYARINTWTGLYRTDFIRKYDILHNETPGASYQDNGFWFQVMTQVTRLYFLQEAFYHLRRDNPNSSMLSKGKVYCLPNELDFMRKFMKNNTVVNERYNHIYWHLYFTKLYYFNLKRIDYCYREEFVHYLHEQLLAYENEFDISLFNKNDLILINEIKSDWQTFYNTYINCPQDVIDFCKDKSSVVLYGDSKKPFEYRKKLNFIGVKTIAIVKVHATEDDLTKICPKIAPKNVDATLGDYSLIALWSPNMSDEELNLMHPNELLIHKD